MGVGAGLYMYVVIVQKFTFAISSPDEFLFKMATVCYIGFVVGKLGPPKGVLGDFYRCAKFG